jgi:ADP-ribosylglycohydrolase
MARKHLGLLLAGLAAGDSLGGTSEFTAREDVLSLYEQYKDRGWPFRHVGGGYFNWRSGQLTDDAVAVIEMVRSFQEKGEFDPEDIAKRFLAWSETEPKDVGTTTLMGIAQIGNGVPWYEGGLNDYKRRPLNASNGSLLRNGVIPGMADSLEDAYKFSLYQSIMTHYAPRPVLSCALQAYIIWEFLEGRNPLEPDWLAKKSCLRMFRESWTDWFEKTRTEDDIVSAWASNVGANLEKGWTDLRESDFDPDNFNPYVYSPRGGAGYVLTAMQIAVWATHWSLRKQPFPCPEGYPVEVFGKTGPWVIGWIPMAGGDTDSYGCVAGPIIAAANNGLPGELIGGLEINEEFGELTKSAIAV